MKRYNAYEQKYCTDLNANRHRIALHRLGDANRIQCHDAEDILRIGQQLLNAVRVDVTLDLGHLNPHHFIRIALFNRVLGDVQAAVVHGRLPLQHHGVLLHLRDGHRLRLVRLVDDIQRQLHRHNARLVARLHRVLATVRTLQRPDRNRAALDGQRLRADDAHAIAIPGHRWSRIAGHLAGDRPAGGSAQLLAEQLLVDDNGRFLLYAHLACGFGGADFVARHTLVCRLRRGASLLDDVACHPVLVHNVLVGRQRLAVLEPGDLRCRTAANDAGERQTLLQAYDDVDQRLLDGRLLFCERRGDQDVGAGRRRRRRADLVSGHRSEDVLAVGAELGHRVRGVSDLSDLRPGGLRDFLVFEHVVDDVGVAVIVWGPPEQRERVVRHLERFGGARRRWFAYCVER